MALCMRQAPGGRWRVELRPNRSCSWAQTKRLLVVVVLINGLIAAVFAGLGLWLVAPFGGLEALALAGGLYRCSRASYQRELILVDAERLVVLSGHDRLRVRQTFVRAWVRLRWRPPGEGCPGCLQLGSHGRFFEIGAFLVEAERRQLAGRLARLLGQPLGAWAPEMALDAGLNREMGL